MFENQERIVEEYIARGDFSGALGEITSIEEKRTLLPQEFIKKEYIKTFIALDKGDFQKGQRIAKNMMLECLKKKYSLLEIDAIIGNIENTVNLGNYNECFKLIEMGKKRIKKIEGKIERKVDLKSRKAYFLFLEGRIYQEQNNGLIAENLFKRSYEIRKDIDDKYGMLFSLINIGVSKHRIGDFTPAKKYLSKGLEIARQIGCEVGIIWGLLNLGAVEFHLRNVETAISLAKECLSISEPKKYKKPSAFCYIIIGNIFLMKGKLERALFYFRKSIDILLETGYKKLIAQSYYSIGNVYSQKGELKKALDYYTKTLSITEEQNDDVSKSVCLTAIGKIYGELGDYNTAKNYLSEALTLLEDVEINVQYCFSFYLSRAKTLHYLIVLAINNKETENIEDFLKKLYQISKENINLKDINQLVRLDEALVLGSSNRLKNKMLAEEIFKQIAEEQIIDHEITIESMTNLCELLIYELEISGDLKILKEIEILTDKLLKIAKEQYLYTLSTETYFLKGKIALLSLDVTKARELLTKAQKIASKYGLKLLAKKVSDEHDRLLKMMDEWEKRIKNVIPLDERLNFARYKFLFSKMIRFEIEDLPKKIETPVYLLILNTIDGTCLYKKLFQEINIDDGNLIGGFISAINFFGKETLSSSGSIDRIKHGEFLIIVRAKADYLFGYIFKGQSYSATLRIDDFIEKLSDQNIILEGITYAVENYRDISQEINQIIDQIVEEIFLLRKN